MIDHLSNMEFIIELWFSNITIIALIAMWIANALAIGSLLEFIAVLRIHHQIDTVGYKLSEIPKTLITVLEILIFISLTATYLIYPNRSSTLFFYVNIGSLGIVSIIFLTGLITGIKTKENRKTLTGLFVAAVFVGIYVFQNINPNAITIVMIAAFIIFLIDKKMDGRIMHSNMSYGLSGVLFAFLIKDLKLQEDSVVH